MTTPTDVLEELGAKFPMRDSHGYVLGHYVYSLPECTRLAGPYPTREEAESDPLHASFLRIGWAQVIVGHVFTKAGTIVREVADTTTLDEIGDPNTYRLRQEGTGPIFHISIGLLDVAQFETLEAGRAAFAQVRDSLEAPEPDCCPECGEHFSDPHAPGCPNTPADDDEDTPVSLEKVGA